MNLRDRNRERRQKRILDAAVQLIAEDGLANLSMRKLGRAAEVSVATIYNICGHREDVVWAVIRERFATIGDAIAEIPADNPIERMDLVFRATAQHLGKEDRSNRAIVLAGVELGPDPRRPNAVRSAIGAAIREAIDIGLLKDELDSEVLSGHILRAYLHAMIGWARGFYTTAGFESLALYSLYASLLGVATDTVRPQVLAQLKRLEPTIEDQPIPVSSGTKAESA